MLRLRHRRIKKLVEDYIGSEYRAGITAWALPTCDIRARGSGNHSTQGHILGGSFIEDRDQLQRVLRKVMGWWGSEYQAVWGTGNIFFSPGKKAALASSEDIPQISEEEKVGLLPEVYQASAGGSVRTGEGIAPWVKGCQISLLSALSYVQIPQFY